jgi:L-aminopeptidase/D-esterase-like protein
MITEVPGVRAGHWTNLEARTGCTVVLLPAGTMASGEVRGGAPGTREWDLLVPGRLMSRVDAVVLAGGSAFGLAACDGVVRWCEERGIGFPTPAGPVPIVVGAVLYDLGVGDPSVRPGPDEGYAACVAATAGALELGAVGAGAGATVGKWKGAEQARAAGVGSAARHAGQLVVAALMVVNAFGDGRDGAAGPVDWPEVAPPSPFENTTIGVVATNATLDKDQCLLVAQSGHDGLARALEPAHSLFDGDALVAAAVGGVDAPLEQVRLLAAQAVEAAIGSALRAQAPA